MKAILLDSLISPDWLKYGFAGLVAIFGILMYFIFKPVITSDPNKKFWVILFILVSLILLSMGGFYIYTTDKFKNDNTKSIDSLASINNDLKRKIEIYSDTSPQSYSLRQKVKENQVKYDSLIKVNLTLEDNIDKKQQIISDLVTKSITESLENDLTATSGKTRFDAKIPDIDYKRLKRAVFLNFTSFYADKEILKQSLFSLQKQSGEFKTSDINRLLNNYTLLMQTRLTWLKNNAIPALQQQILYLRDNPQVQEGLYARVKLPQDIWVIPVNRDNGGNEVTVDDLALLKKERDLLIDKISR